MDPTGHIVTTCHRSDLSYPLKLLLPVNCAFGWQSLKIQSDRLPPSLPNFLETLLWRCFGYISFHDLKNRTQVLPSAGLDSPLWGFGAATVTSRFTHVGSRLTLRVVLVRSLRSLVRHRHTTVGPLFKWFVFQTTRDTVEVKVIVFDSGQWRD